MTEIERELIHHHKLDIEKCFDAQGRNIDKERKLYMQRNDFHFAYNCYPCNENHTLKNKENSCIICKPMLISIHKREHGKGYLYIAASRWGKWIKIGCTTNYEKREKYLNEYKGYGFKADWKILAVAKVDEMGVRERQVQNELKKYREFGIQYYRAKELKKTNELFRCSYEKAYEAMENLCKENKFHFKVLNIKFHDYKFRNLLKK